MAEQAKLDKKLKVLRAVEVEEGKRRTLQSTVKKTKQKIFAKKFGGAIRVSKKISAGAAKAGKGFFKFAQQAAKQAQQREVTARKRKPKIATAKKTKKRSSDLFDSFL